MDHHKRGYDDLENEAVSSPTKRLKDLSHNRDYLCADHHQDSGSHGSCRSLRVGYHAQVNRSQYKTRIQYGRPQVCRSRRAQSVHNTTDLEAGAGAAPGFRKQDQTPAGTAPARNCTYWSNHQRELDLEAQIEDSAYHKMIPIVKKELERWVLCGKRAPERVQSPGARAGGVKPDDETTCAVCLKPRKFKGWGALLIHAQKYSKQMASQHRGYCRALQEALFEKTVADRCQQAAAAEIATRCTVPAPTSAKSKPAHHCTDVTRKDARWRPDILIVENEQFDEVGHILKSMQQQQDHSQAAGGPKPKLREVLAVYSHGDGADEQRQVFVFPASKVGYVGEAEVNSYRQSGAATDREKPENYPNQSKDGDHVPTADQTEIGDDHHVRTRTSESETTARPSCSVDHSSVTIGDDGGTTTARCESLKEALGLRLTLDDPVDDTRPGRQKLFDVEQIRRTSSVVERWVESFTSSAKKFEVQRVFRCSSKMVASDDEFRADLKRIKTYSPGCKRKIKEHTSKIEDRIREDHLMWLQQLDEVREQFQALADDVQHEEARDKRCTMRAEVEVWKQRHKQEKEEQYEALRAAQAKAIAVVRGRKVKQQQERAQMMQLWMEDAQQFKQESAAANEERRRLEKIHGPVHDGAKQARKDCPVCLESFRVKALCKPAEL